MRAGRLSSRAGLGSAPPPRAGDRIVWVPLRRILRSRMPKRRRSLFIVGGGIHRALILTDRDDITAENVSCSAVNH